MGHVSSTMWGIKYQPSNSTSCSDNTLRLLVLVVGRLYWGLQVMSSYSIWGCALKGCLEGGIFGRAKSRLKGIEDFNLERCPHVLYLNLKTSQSSWGRKRRSQFKVSPTFKTSSNTRQTIKLSKESFPNGSNPWIYMSLRDFMDNSSMDNFNFKKEEVNYSTFFLLEQRLSTNNIWASPKGGLGKLIAFKPLRKLEINGRHMCLERFYNIESSLAWFASAKCCSPTF